MKKIFILIILGLFLITGCGKTKDVNDTTKDNSSGNNKKTYQISDITKSFIYTKGVGTQYAFTETELIKFNSATSTDPSNSLYLDLYTEDKLRNFSTNVQISPYKVTDSVNKFYNSEAYTIVEQNENEACIIEESSKEYIYIANFNNGSLSFITSEFSANGLDQYTIFPLLKTAINTISIVNDDTQKNIYELATNLELPLNMKINKGKVLSIYKDTVEFVTPSKDEEKWQIYYIKVFYNLRKNVKLKRVSENPKIDQYEFNYNTFYRVYEDKTYDVNVYESDYKDNDHDVDTYEEFLKAIKVAQK